MIKKLDQKLQDIGSSQHSLQIHTLCILPAVCEALNLQSCSRHSDVKKAIQICL